MWPTRPANDAAFGRPGSSRREGGGAFPQLRLVGWRSAGTHAITDAALGPYYDLRERVGRRAVGSRLRPGMLCLADRGFYSFERFQAARETGAQLLWRVKSDCACRASRPLADGSYLSAHLRAGATARQARRQPRCASSSTSSMIPGSRKPEQRYRLLTRSSTPTQAPARRARRALLTSAGSSRARWTS